MILRVENSWTWVTGSTEQELDWASSFLSFENAQAARARAMGYDVADRVKLVQRRGHGMAFPTGLLPVLRAGAERAGVVLQEVDARAGMPTHDVAQLREPPWNMTGSYAHQTDAIEAWLAGGPELVKFPLNGRGIIWSPTASGKGRIAVGVAHAVEAHWLFVVHRGHLVDDVRGRWAELTGTEAGLIGDGVWRVGERLTCATLQSLHAAKGQPEYTELAAKVTGLIVDEAHIAPAATFYAVIQSFKQARLRIGLSGTPLDRSDQRSMVAIGAIGPIVYRIKAAVLQGRGVMATPTVRVIPVAQKAPKGVYDWKEVYESLIVRSAHRNGAVLAAMERARSDGELPGMVFVRSVEHGRLLTREAEARGMNVRFVSGAASLIERKTACAQLTSGRLDFIVATKVFTEGVDVPALRTVVNAQGGKSVSDTLQQIGRALRVTAGKREATIYEIGDNGNAMLHGHAKARVAACQREGYRCVVDTTLYPETQASLSLR